MFLPLQDNSGSIRPYSNLIMVVVLDSLTILKARPGHELRLTENSNLNLKIIKSAPLGMIIWILWKSSKHDCAIQMSISHDPRMLEAKKGTTKEGSGSNGRQPPKTEFGHYGPLMRYEHKEMASDAFFKGNDISTII